VESGQEGYVQDACEQLALEDGPWRDDTVNDSYDNQRGESATLPRRCRSLMRSRAGVHFKTHTRRFSSTVSGYRYYSPALQRWLNSDPAGQQGFETLRTAGRSQRMWFQRIATAVPPGRPAEASGNPSLFEFVGNGPVEGVDSWGDVWYKPRTWKLDLWLLNKGSGRTLLLFSDPFTSRRLSCFMHPCTFLRAVW
jgi:hypothetical protein